jgi:hypothetical protein
MTDLAEAMFSAHVEYELGRLRGQALAELIEEQTLAAFAWLEDVKFNDIVTRAQIMGVIDRYVIELKVSGGITELAGEMSRVVFSSTASATTRVEDVLSNQAYEDFTDKIAGLGNIQGELIRYVTRTTAFGNLASRVLSRVITDLVFRKTHERPQTAVAGLVGAALERVLPGFERRIGEALSRYLEPYAARLTKSEEAHHLLDVVEPEWVRQMADEIWDEVSEKPLAEAGRLFSAQDLEDFVVLGYEFWQKFRKTRYFRAVSEEVVNRLFDKYGEESVFSVIADMGVTERMVTEELKIFLLPLMERAFATDFLEQQVRAYLEPFYHSPALAALLAR